MNHKFHSSLAKSNKKKRKKKETNVFYVFAEHFNCNWKLQLKIWKCGSCAIVKYTNLKTICHQTILTKLIGKVLFLSIFKIQDELYIP